MRFWPVYVDIRGLLGNIWTQFNYLGMCKLVITFSPPLLLSSMIAEVQFQLKSAVSLNVANSLLIFQGQEDVKVFIWSSSHSLCWLCPALRPETEIENALCTPFFPSKLTYSQNLPAFLYTPITSDNCRSGNFDSIWWCTVALKVFRSNKYKLILP